MLRVVLCVTVLLLSVLFVHTVVANKTKQDKTIAKNAKVATKTKETRNAISITSGYDEVVKYSTAISFYMKITNNKPTPFKVTAIPVQCCLNIDVHDTDCSIMEFRRPVSANLGVEGENSTAHVVFLFRNLYARYRIGNCSFTISVEGQSTMEYKHTIKFNTYPVSSERLNCSGIDQDPDRGCSPVDCAIKYKGKRSFYRNSTGKCEPVVHCNTRSPKDGVTNIGYYDWDENICVRYEWFENDNYFKQIESDTEIPNNVDPSPNSVYYPDLEPEKLAQMMDSGKKVELVCNHGHQNGIYCDCDEGWTSSGIHRDNPLIFHWCDSKKSDPYNSNELAPRKLGRALEIFAIISLSLVNFGLMFAWPYLLAKLACPDIFQKRFCGLCCRRKKII